MATTSETEPLLRTYHAWLYIEAKLVLDRYDELFGRYPQPFDSDEATDWHRLNLKAGGLIERRAETMLDRLECNWRAEVPR